MPPQQPRRLRGLRLVSPVNKDWSSQRLFKGSGNTRQTHKTSKGFARRLAAIECRAVGFVVALELTFRASVLEIDGPPGANALRILRYDRKANKGVNNRVADERTDDRIDQTLHKGACEAAVHEYGHNSCGSRDLLACVL